MKKHELKTIPVYFEAVLKGKKTFEVRKDDRGFQVGDILILKEWDPKIDYTGREIVAPVSYKFDGGEYGVKKEFCIMAIKPLHDRICSECGKAIRFDKFSNWRKLELEDAMFKWQYSHFLTCKTCTKNIKKHGRPIP